MLSKQIEELKRILSDEDLQKYRGDAFWNLILAVIAADAFAGITAAKDVKELIFHMPTVLFWDKMKRYLMGTFYSFEDQVKMAAKFNPDSEDYTLFVKRQIHLVNEINDDEKIDYLASLTRCYLLTELEQDLYFKLFNFITMCTPEELGFLKGIQEDSKLLNSSIVSGLYQFGLIEQGDTIDHGYGYVLTDYGKALKQNCLNFDEDCIHTIKYYRFDQICPIRRLEPMPIDGLNA